MATFENLITRADKLVGDSSLYDNLGDFINQGVQEIAGGVKSLLLDVIIPPLPNLFTIATVITTTEAFVDMPNTYQRGLQLAVSSSGTEINIANSFIDFSRTYPALDRVGSISEVVEFGDKLYYQGIPKNAEEVTLHFYRKPIDMVEDTDTPDGVPEHLQIALLTNFAAWKAYEIIEDGLEGEMPNTIKFKNAFLEAVLVLELSIPTDSTGFALR